MNGLLTEREWRRRTETRRRQSPAWVGAQCVTPVLSAGRRLRQDRAFRVFLLLVSLMIALSLPLMVPRKPVLSIPSMEITDAASGRVPRSVREISYQLPQKECRVQTFPRSQLLRGKLLFLDCDHPLPGDILPPNTFSIAAAASGMVPVSSLSIRSGKETIAALRELFAALRVMGVEGLTVSMGTVSAAQQRQWQRDAAAVLMQTQPVNIAVQNTLQRLDRPAQGEMLLEYAVEIRLRSAPDMPLENSRQGQALLQQAWRHGFVRTNPQSRPFRFRYVGKAHATAMTYLDVNFGEYLNWMHQKGSLAVSTEGELRYLILCQPVTDDHASFSLPVDARCEVSLDNTGYALAACTW